MTRTVKPPLKHPGGGGLGALLTYRPDYGVVICKDCHFAIQPNAFSSHLQNHHILRSERRRILDQLSSLHLRAPDRVILPATDSRRIVELDVVYGLRCISAPECNYACTSAKRMSQHWSAVHNEPNSKAIKYREAKLQTFFRGNKIRYFEVEGPTDVQCGTLKESTLPPVNLADETLHGIQAPSLDYQSLLYMHHYVRHSSLFLNRGNENTGFWVDTIVLEAYRHPFLMHGLLCISAIDKARGTTDYRERRQHLRASASYCAGAISGYRVAVVSPTENNSTALIACSRLLGQQEAVRDLIKSQEMDHDFTIEDIIEHLVLLRGCTDLMMQLQSTLPPQSPFRLPDKVKIGLKQIGENEDTVIALKPSCIPAGTWLILDTLEAKLKAAGLLLEIEVPTIRRAINSLTFAASHAYNAEEDDFASSGWTAVEGWLRSPVVSDELLPAMRVFRPAALVVFISWVMLLLKRIEAEYAWMTDLSAWFVRVAINVAQSSDMENLVRALFKFD
ncbi:hypothetical protein GGR51DRAFT_296011 [Nemania sp. FL0031]|nr:hypothetical protein GGR51DRAFT_296011 [Nemania sp. FL0031]